jgi:hypothetical protein
MKLLADAKAISKYTYCIRRTFKVSKPFEDLGGDLIVVDNKIGINIVMITILKVNFLQFL